MANQGGSQKVDVLVSGSEGFIGKHLCRKLAEEGISFFGADINDGIDLSDPAYIDQLPAFRVAVHLAAKTFVPESWKDPYSFFRTNINTTLNVLEACRRSKGRMIMASTYVYGIPEHLPINEDHPLSALNPYAHSKLSAESLCLGYAQSGDMPLLIFRPFNVYGPGQDSRFLIPSILEQWKQGRVMLKDPAPKRDYIFVEDMIDAYIKAIRNGFTGVEIVNIGSGESHSVKEMAEIMAEMLPGEVIISYDGEVRKNEISETRADIRKAEALLGWIPRHNLRDGLKKTIQQEQNG